MKAAMRRKEIESPQDHARKLRVDDLVLRKRTSFANVTKKTAFKLTIDAYKVVARVATNSFWVKSLMDGALY